MTRSRRIHYHVTGNDRASWYRYTALLLSILALLPQIAITMETIYPVCEQNIMASSECCRLNLTLTSTGCPLAECPVGYFMPSYTSSSPASTVATDSTTVTSSGLPITTTVATPLITTDSNRTEPEMTITRLPLLHTTGTTTTDSGVTQSSSSNPVDIYSQILCNITGYPEIQKNDNYGPCSVRNNSGGQFVLITPCRPCSENCSRCTGMSDNSCTDCTAGYFLFRSKCLLRCPGNFKGKAGICVAKQTDGGGSEEDSADVGAIVGGVIGGILVLVIIIVVIIYFCRRKQWTPSENSLHRKKTLVEMAEQRENVMEMKTDICHTDETDPNSQRDSHPYSPNPTSIRYHAHYPDDEEIYKNDDVNRDGNSEFYEVNTSNRPVTHELEVYANIGQAEQTYEINVSNAPIHQDAMPDEPMEIYENPSTLREMVNSGQLDSAPPLPPPAASASGYFVNEEIIKQQSQNMQPPPSIMMKKLNKPVPRTPDRKKPHHTGSQNPSPPNSGINPNSLSDSHSNKPLPHQVPKKSPTFHDAINSLNYVKQTRSGSVPCLTMTEAAMMNVQSSSDSDSSYQAMDSKSHRAAIIKARKGSLTPVVRQGNGDDMDVYELPVEGTQCVDKPGGMAAVLAELRREGIRSAQVSEIVNDDDQEDYENLGNFQQNLQDMDSDGLVLDDAVYGNIPNSVSLPVPDYSQDESSDYECPPVDHGTNPRWQEQFQRRSDNNDQNNDHVDSLDDLDDYENFQTIQKVMSK